METTGFVKRQPWIAVARKEESNVPTAQKLGRILHGPRLHRRRAGHVSAPACGGGAGEKQEADGHRYNGSPAGVPDCYDRGCLIERYVENGVEHERCIRTIHAEVNLILFTDRADREGGTVYVTDEPCWNCAKMLANSGIVEIVYERPYEKDHEKVERLMAEAGIRLRRYVRERMRDEQA